MFLSTREAWSRALNRSNRRYRTTGGRGFSVQPGPRSRSQIAHCSYQRCGVNTTIHACRWKRRDHHVMSGLLDQRGVLTTPRPESLQRALMYSCVRIYRFVVLRRQRCSRDELSAFATARRPLTRAVLWTPLVRFGRIASTTTDVILSTDVYVCDHRRFRVSHGQSVARGLR